MEEYGWYRGDELGVTPNAGCLKHFCGTKLCLVCMARNHARTVWRGATELIDATTEQIKNRKEHVGNYDGSNEQQFVRMTSEWLFSDQKLRTTISRVGYEYLTKEEIWEQTQKVHHHMIVDGRYVEDAIKIRGHRAIKERHLTWYLKETLGDWWCSSSKKAAETTLAVLGLHWYQERAVNGDLDDFGNMTMLHKNITAKIRRKIADDETTETRGSTLWTWGEWSHTPWEGKRESWNKPDLLQQGWAGIFAGEGETRKKEVDWGNLDQESMTHSLIVVMQMSQKGDTGQ